MGRTAVAARAPPPPPPNSPSLLPSLPPSLRKSVLATVASAALFERMRKPKVDDSGGPHTNVRPGLDSVVAHDGGHTTDETTRRDIDIGGERGSAKSAEALSDGREERERRREGRGREGGEGEWKLFSNDDSCIQPARRGAASCLTQCIRIWISQ